MRPLPSSLLTKLQSKFQTIYNDAQPQIQLIIQRAKRYIGAGIEFEPYTVREESGLGAMDVSLRKEDRRVAPDKVFMVYVLNGIARVAQQDYVVAIEDIGEWEELYTLGPAVDVATEFDGFWERTAKDAQLCFDSPAVWIHTTAGDPWFFWVTPTGALNAQQGQGTPVELASGGVTKVSAIRGWKSVPQPDNDHGLLVAYVKNGEVFYRNLAEQSNATVIWESEKAVTQFGTGVQNIGTFRTNDFRVGIVAEVAGDIQWVVTERNWSGMAVTPEIIAASIKDLGIDLIKVTYKNGYDNEIIAGSITDLIMDLYWAGETLPVKAENIAITDTVTAEAVGTGDGVEMVFSLLHAPLTQTVYVDAVEVTNYTVDGKDITFASAPTGAITADYTWSNWGKQIKITMDHGVTDVTGSHSAFAVADDALTPFYPTAIASGEIGVDTPSTFDGSDELILTVGDFNDAVNPLTVTFTSPGPKGEIGQAISSFAVEFEAVNLDPLGGGAPEVEMIWNE